jgi:sterol desaturase/sphingolipid hydroxylase (fatty acid hydroxylase superfamily)
MLIFCSFVLLMGFSLLHPLFRGSYLTKPLRDWILDGCGLFCQGVVIPGLQVILVVGFWQKCFPTAQGCLHLDRGLAFVLSFVGVDYLYYWNHRLLHTRIFWPLHRVHHSSTHMDVLCTSRNTLWTSFLILYLWIHGLFLYLLQDPTSYLLGVSFTSVLDLWRHSPWIVPQSSWLYRLSSSWLILPQDHHCHHRQGSLGQLFGANLKIWDQLHSTWNPDISSAAPLGIPVLLPLWKQLLWPFSSQQQ